MATSSRRSNAAVLPVSSPFQCNSPIMASSDPSPTYYSPSHPHPFFNQRRSASPTRLILHSSPPTPSVRFSIDRSISPRRSIAAPPPPRNHVVHRTTKRTCLCSPTTHPGSFRCALHKNSFGGAARNHSIPYSPNRLNMRRSAMTNSLVRIGTVEGDLVKRALAALIRPSSHQQRRRADFQRRPSRLSTMSKAEDL
ncbi:hypothetical protein Salat_2647800 [Sesamum alatum]|uniref:Serine-rich protein-like protein n=1 Tax=Sesamum alatum TaxID=300844 RepID=A0AAE1XP36_9LAMI|nr:hypothetical protein Salat_2647800 [Sesamum alatum]